MANKGREVFLEELAKLEWNGTEPPFVPVGFKAALAKAIVANDGRGFQIGGPPLTQEDEDG